MRTLVVGAAALGLAAAAAAAPPREPETVWSGSHARVAAFAQDGAVIAWFAAGARGCNTVHLRSLRNGASRVLPRQDARNVTCRGWNVDSGPVRLALAGTDALWTLRADAPIPFDYLIGASVRDPRERRFQEIAHTKRGSGLWLGGVAGDRHTLVYAVAAVSYLDEAGCLAGTGSCRLAVTGGGVYRVAGRQRPRLVPGTSSRGAVAVAASGHAVAYVRAAARVDPRGRPVAAARLPVEVVDARTGVVLTRVRPRGTPLAVALTPHFVATLEQTTLGLRIAWYDRSTGSLGGGSVPVPAETSPQLTASDRWVVFRVGRSIRAVELATHRVLGLARAAARPVGLSLEGRRLAWAENLPRVARIRRLDLPAATR